MKTHGIKKVCKAMNSPGLWEIDECANTHHFIPILDHKNTENTQICHKIQQISMDCFFFLFQV
jgi:hypothetical protein